MKRIKVRDLKTGMTIHPDWYVWRVFEIPGVVQSAISFYGDDQIHVVDRRADAYETIFLVSTHNEHGSDDSFYAAEDEVMVIE